MLLNWVNKNYKFIPKYVKTCSRSSVIRQITDDLVDVWVILGEVTEFTSGGGEIFIHGGENFDVAPPCRRRKIFGAPPPCRRRRILGGPASIHFHFEK